MAKRVPNVFLSSTFYDLRHIRNDIAQFVESDLAYRLIASEFHTFPVDPDANSVENCRRRVLHDADIFVLIVGARYGSLPAGGAVSVTNLEYLAARTKAIPIFAFISQDVISLLPVYEKNPEADFTSVVDNPRLFQFVNDIRGETGVWAFQFGNADDIVRTLRVQFAYAMGNGLELSSKLHLRDRDLLHLRGEAFRLAVEQPEGWEASLFAELVEQEVQEADYMRRDHEARVVLGRGELVPEQSMVNWMVSVTNEASRLVTAMETVAKHAINRGFATGDLSGIIYGARRIGSMYREAYEWALNIRRAHVPERWTGAVDLLATLLDDFTEECRAFISRMKQQIDAALVVDAPGTVKISLTFNFHIGTNDLLQAELERLKRSKPT